jgi:hypothetical protein
MLYPTLLCAIVLICGCVAPNTQRIMYDQARPAVAPDSVQVCSRVPSNAVCICSITVSTERNDQAATEIAQAELKKSAAAVGANRVVIKNYKTYAIGTFYLTGQGYYVPVKNPSPRRPVAN